MAMTLMEIIKKYFDIYEAGSARDIYFRLGRTISYFSIQKVLDELERTNYIQHKSVRSTHYKSPIINVVGPFIMSTANRFVLDVISSF